MSKELQKLTKDYLAVVKKFDDCRATIAHVLKTLGGDPDGQSDNDKRPWHEYLIDKVNKLLRDKKC